MGEKRLVKEKNIPISSSDPSSSTIFGEKKKQFAKAGVFQMKLQDCLFFRFHTHKYLSILFTWKFLNQILLSSTEKDKTWSTNGLLLGWKQGVLKICEQNRQTSKKKRKNTVLIIYVKKLCTSDWLKTSTFFMQNDCKVVRLSKFCLS